MKNILLGAVAFVFAAEAASAATVNVTRSLTPAQTLAALQDVALPDVATPGRFNANVTGSNGARRSPYDTIPSLATTGKYHSVQGGGTATYLFDTVQSDFSLIWGSPDSYNTLSFFNGSDEVDLGALGLSITGDEIGALAPINQLGREVAFVAISDLFFDKVVLTSGRNAFEYGLVGATPVPLPAAAWLLLAGMGALVAVRRKTA